MVHPEAAPTSSTASPAARRAEGERQTTRLEAFSDGVFAIAITLLILEIKAPVGDDLLQGLLHEWPSFLSFALSFVTILIMWTNHHANLRRVHRVDARILFANGFLLLFVTFIPFPTAVLAEHLTRGDARVAAGFYAATFVGINLAWLVFWRSVTSRRAALAPTLSLHEVRFVNLALVVGLTSYLVATALAFWSAAASVSMCLLLAAFWTVQALRADRHPPLEAPEAPA